MSDDYDDYYDDERRWPVWAAGVGAIVLVSAAGLWFGISTLGGDGDETDAVVSANPVSEPVITGAPVDDTVPDRPTTTSTVTATTVSPGDSSAPITTTPITTTPITTTPGAAAPATAQSYETLPDGSPVPLLAVFDDDLIALSGVVPDAESAERLRILALSYSESPDAQVVSFVTVDPTVPVSVGVRLVEVNSVQFDDGLPDISAEYAGQLDRVVALMTSLPNVTVDVIGHTDQNSDEGDAFELSASRAQATVDVLVEGGIDPSRLSARGASATDLLTLNSDEVALALNRRTEFVVFGLLVGASVPG